MNLNYLCNSKKLWTTWGFLKKRSTRCLNSPNSGRVLVRHLATGIFQAQGEIIDPTTARVLVQDRAEIIRVTDMKGTVRPDKVTIIPTGIFIKSIHRIKGHLHTQPKHLKNQWDYTDLEKRLHRWVLRYTNLCHLFHSV